MQISFCRKTGVPILGVIENMASFICLCCFNSSKLFPSTTGGAKAMCVELCVKLLMSLPFDPRMAECADLGEDFFDKCPDSPAVKSFLELASFIVN